MRSDRQRVGKSGAFEILVRASPHSVLYEVIEAVRLRQKPFVARQGPRIFRGAAAGDLLLHQEDALTEFRWQLVEEADAGNQPVLPHQADVRVSSIEAEVWHHQLPL